MPRIKYELRTLVGSLMFFHPKEGYATVPLNMALVCETKINNIQIMSAITDWAKNGNDCKRNSLVFVRMSMYVSSV